MEKLLKNKRFFSILLLICLVGFLILPNICLANDFDNISLKEMGKYLELPQKDANNLMDTLRQVFTTEGIFLWSSEDVTQEKIAVAVTLLKVVKMQALSHLLVDAPIEITKNIIKGAVKIARLVGVQDISVVINEFEKESVKMAVEYGMKSLFQNQIRVTPGAINFKYHSYKKGEQEITLQYVMVYKPDRNSKRAKVEIRFYMPNSIESPDAKKYNRGITSLPVPNLKKDLSPFIIEINGIVEKRKFDNYQWVNEKGEISHPSVKIDFPDFVPDFGIKPLNRLEYHLFKPFETKIREIEVVITKVTGKSLGITENVHSFPELVFSIWNKIKSGLFKFNPFEPAIVGQSVVEQKLIEVKSLSIPEQSVEVGTVEGGCQQPVAVVEGTVEVRPQPLPKKKLSLAEIQEKLDDIAERIDIINREVEKLGMIRVRPRTVPEQEGEMGIEESIAESKEIKEIDEQELEEQEQEKELEQKMPVIICAKSAGSAPARNKIIINEVAWMGTTNNHNDEWIELKNISGKEINLDGWQVLDKEKQIKIIFGGGQTPATPAKFSANSYFLLERTDDNSAPNKAADFIYTGGLNNTNEALYLFDENCQLQDEVVTASNWSYGDNSSKRTMERKTNLNWQTSANPGGTPKTANSNGYFVYSGGGGGGGITPLPEPDPDPLPVLKILISEIQISPIEERFIELYNPNDKEVDLTNWYLQRKTANATKWNSFVSSSKFEGKIIPAKSYFLIARFSRNTDIFVENLTLTENNALSFKNPNQEIVDKVGWGEAQDFETASFHQNPEIRDPIGDWLDELGFTGSREPFLSFIYYQSLGRKINEQGEEQDIDNNAEDFEIQNPTPKSPNETFIEPELEDILENIDSTPPEIEIISGPPFLTNQIQSEFFFQCNEENCSFQCQLDKQGWQDCQFSQPQTYTDLSDGQYKFSVKATDLFSNESLPIEYIWEIDTTIDSPFLSLFDLDTNSQFYTNELTIEVGISNDEDVSFWLLSETQIEKPEIDNSAWQTEKPSTFILSDSDGAKTVYIWTKDEANNISEGISDSIILDNTAPIADAGLDQTIVINQAINLDGSGSSDNVEIVSFQWDIDDKNGLDWDIPDFVVESPVLESGYTELGSYTVTLQVADAAGNTALDSLLITVVEPNPTLEVVMNEIAWAGTSAASFNDEWIELYNNTDEKIDLDGWTLNAIDGTPEIELAGIIQPQNYFLLERTDDYTIRDILADQIYIGGLNNAGEKLELRNADGKLIDLVDCSEKWFAGEASPNYISMERISMVVSGSDPDNWASNNLITRNGYDIQNKKINGTPKAENSVSKLQTEIFYGLPFSEFDEITLTKLGAPYIIKTSLGVPLDKTLKIDPGVTLKFFDIASGMHINGTLEAIGSDESDEKITFTSRYSDPWPGSWGQIYFSETSINSELNNVIVEYGGIYSCTDPRCPWQRAVIRVNESQNFVLKNSTIQHNKNKGLFLMNCPSNTLIYNVLFQENQVGCSTWRSTDDAIAILVQGGSPVIENCVFNKNTIGIKITNNASSIIKDNTFTENEKPIYVYNSCPDFINNQTPGNSNHINDIFVFSIDVNQDYIWKAGLSYIIDNRIVVAQDIVLTIEPGVIMKFYDEHSGMAINGTLKAIGSADENIIFTSRIDIDYGGRGAFPGSWQQIYFSETSIDSVLDYVVVKYGGRWATSWGVEPMRAAIRVKETSITLKNSIVENNRSRGLYLIDSSSIIDNVQFLNHQVGCGNHTAIALLIERGDPVINENCIFNNNAEDIKIIE